MDATRFDALSRTFVGSPTRRGALRALAGLIAAAAVGRFAPAHVAAKRDPKKPCPPCRKKKDGKCNKGKKPDGTVCGDGKICISGKCRDDPDV